MTMMFLFIGRHPRQRARWLAPLIGGVLGGAIYRWLSEQPTGTVEGRVPG